MSGSPPKGLGIFDEPGRSWGRILRDRVADPWVDTEETWGREAPARTGGNGNLRRTVYKVEGTLSLEEVGPGVETLDDRVRQCELYLFPLLLSI